MKPQWRNAPLWANYFAQDLSGAWFWYEKEPKIIKGIRHWYFEEGKTENAYLPISDWKKSLEKRPNEIFKNKNTIRNSNNKKRK